MVYFKDGRERQYDSPDDFLGGIQLSEISRTNALMIGDVSGPVAVTAYIRKTQTTTFIRCSGAERAAVEGVCKLVTELFRGSRFVRPGLRQPGKPSMTERIRSRLGWVIVIAIAAAITAVVTILVGHFFH